MLWSEMDEHQRELHTKSARHWLPADTELLELVDILWCGWECDYAAALIRTADGSVRVKILAGVSDPGGGRSAGDAGGADRDLRRAIRNTRRFIESAYAAFKRGDGDPDSTYPEHGECDVTVAALEILARAPDVPPDPGDELKPWGSGNGWLDLGLPDPDDDGR